MIGKKIKLAMKINCGNKFDENKFFDMRLEKLICLIYDIGGK